MFARAMARYFFDLSADRQPSRDPEGTDLDGLERAREEAHATLAGIARDKLPGGGDRRDLVMNVRNDKDVVLRMSPSLRVPA